jgi:hypothetical protein
MQTINAISCRGYFRLSMLIGRLASFTQNDLYRKCRRMAEASRAAAEVYLPPNLK